MRIFLSCQQSEVSHPVPAYQFWETYFKCGISESGHEWCEARKVDWARGLVYTDKDELDVWRSRSWATAIAELKAAHKRQPVDLFLSYLFPKQVDVAAIEEIQRLGIPCVNFFCDNVRDFLHVPECFKVFDLHWVPEFKALAMYRKAGLHFVHAPMPMWAPHERRVWEHSESYGISFIGSRDALREALLAQALERGAEIQIRGAGWIRDNNTDQGMRVGSKGIYQTFINQITFLRETGAMSWGRKMMAMGRRRPDQKLFDNAVRKKPDADEYVEITQQSVVTLGINRYPSFRHPLSRPDTYSRLRDLEAPMLGACYLTEWTEGLDQLYEIGDEIETYRSAEEMIWKIRELKSNPEKRKRLRRKGQRRALNDHSVSQSLKKITAAL